MLVLQERRKKRRHLGSFGACEVFGKFDSLRVARQEVGELRHALGRGFVAAPYRERFDVVEETLGECIAPCDFPFFVIPAALELGLLDHAD